MYKKILILTLSLLIISCKDNQITLEHNETIVAFGDSLTVGYGAAPEESYPTKLSEITGYKVINAGLSGDTAANGKSRIVEIVEQYKPKAVIVSLGGNDMLKQEAKNLENDLNQIVTYLKTKKILVIMLAQPRPNLLAVSNDGFQFSDANVYEKVADKQNVILLKNIFSTYFNDKDYKSDLIHLNSDGYNLVAEDIANNLKKEKVLSF